jgi:3-hydroxyisobutyrate dehydrogenase
MTAVAVVGLGRMGGPMADDLVAAGHDVRVHDVEPAAVAARVARGAIAAESAADAARGAELVCIVVFDDGQAQDVVAGPAGVLATLEPGAIVAVHTTLTLATITELAALGEERGVSVVDAGISGGEPGAQQGTLLTMVGGPASVVERARPVLAGFSKEVLHAGPLGAGMALKLARNATGYAMMAAVHEAIDLAGRSGVEESALRHVIAETGVLDQALSPFAFGGPEALPADAPAEQRELMEHLDRLASKDLDATLDLADRLRTRHDLLEATRLMFHRVARLPD